MIYLVSQERMTLELRYSVIEIRNFHGGMEMSFFGMPLAQTWLARTQYHAKDAILVKNEKRYSKSRARAGLIYS